MPKLTTTQDTPDLLAVSAVALSIAAVVLSLAAMLTFARYLETDPTSSLGIRLLFLLILLASGYSLARSLGAILHIQPTEHRPINQH